MGRINGTNSDYVYDSALPEPSIKEVYPASPVAVEMSLFICPYNEDSRIQADSNFCVGDNHVCPNHSSPVSNTGHALVQLHQNQGIRLQTDYKASLQLDQSGNIHLQPTQTTANPQSGKITFKKTSSNRIIMEATTSELIIQTSSGASISFKSNGDIELKPKSGRKVEVVGSMHISGNLDVDGTITP